MQGDTIGRTEDQIIARTWRLFIEEIVDDSDVNLLFPMTRVSRNGSHSLSEIKCVLTKDKYTYMSVKGQRMNANQCQLMTWE